MADGTKPPLSVSFEFFPPRDAEAANALSGTITKLKAFRPDFVSVTYGAGGSNHSNRQHRSRKVYGPPRAVVPGFRAVLTLAPTARSNALLRQAVD